MIMKSATSNSLAVGYIIPVLKDCITFLVLGQEVNLFSDQLSSGLNTVGELEDKFYYLGSELPNITAAIFTWQDIKGRELTSEEFRQVLLDNKIIGEDSGC